MRKQIQAGASMAYASADENEQQIADRRRASGVDSVVRMDAWSRKSRHAHELCIQSEPPTYEVTHLYVSPAVDKGRKVDPPQNLIIPQEIRFDKRINGFVSSSPLKTGIILIHALKVTAS